MKKLQHIILCFLIVFTSKINGQHQSCATDLRMKEYMRAHPEEVLKNKKNEQLLQKAIEKNYTNKNSNEVYYIPLVIHVMHNGEAIGTGSNITTEQINSGIEALNHAFRNTNGEGVDVGIEFMLAKQDPFGAPTTGIVRYDASAIPGYSANGLAIQSQGADEVSLKAASKWPNDFYYNIWIVSEIEGNNGGFGTQGFAYFPTASSALDGAVLLHTAWGNMGTVNSWNNLSVTITHELGHALGLYHTFHVQNDEDTLAGGCPINNDCSTEGDLICDTDPHTVSESFSCKVDEINNCTGNLYGDVVRNYMDYSEQACQEVFTQDQKDRMRAALTTFRYGLTKGKVLQEPIANCGSAPITPTCSPQTQSQGLNGYFAGIGAYEFNDVLFESSFSTSDQDSGYIDMTDSCLLTAFVAIDSSYLLKITPVGGNPVETKTWIDYNNDGNFTAQELVFEGNHPGGAADSAMVTIPNTAEIGQRLRLRTMLDIGTITDACTEPVYGQAEDFSIYIYASDEVTSVTHFNSVQNKISIAPNPVANILSVANNTIEPQNTVFEIFNTQGSLASNGILTNNKIDVSNLTQGTYFLRLVFDGRSEIQSFIKM